jgi:hypothetical protein
MWMSWPNHASEVSATKWKILGKPTTLLAQRCKFLLNGAMKQGFLFPGETLQIVVS